MKAIQSDQFSRMGMAAMLPGMQYMVEMMQRQLDEFRERLNAYQPKRGRPRKHPVESLFDEATGQRLHPRDAQHPEHAAWLAQVRESNAAKWASLSPKQRKQRIAKMGASQKRKRSPKTTGGLSWANLTAEERSVEMKRRMAVA